MNLIIYTTVHWIGPCVETRVYSGGNYILLIQRVYKTFVNHLSLAKYFNDVSFGLLTGNRQFSKSRQKSKKYDCLLSLTINLLMIVNNFYIAR